MEFEIIRWVIAGILGAFFLALAIFNGWALGWRQWVRRELEGISPAPIIGGLSGFSSIMVMPIESIGTRVAFAWIPLVLDLGTLPYLLGGLVYAIRGHRRR